MTEPDFNVCEIFKEQEISFVYGTLTYFFHTECIRKTR
jgi:hypothetical protein